MNEQEKFNRAADQIVAFLSGAVMVLVIDLMLTELTR